MLWADLYIHVLPEAPGCTDAMANRALRAAAREFCEFTKVHKLDLTPFVLAADTATYVLTDAYVPVQCEVYGVNKAYIGENTDLLELDTESLREVYGVAWKTKTGAPRHYMLERQNLLRVVPYPEEELPETLNVEAILRPKRLATGVEDWIGEEYAEALAAGALALILSMPPAPQPQQAAQKRGEFMAAMGKAQMAAFKGKVRSRVRTRAYFM